MYFKKPLSYKKEKYGKKGQIQQIMFFLVVIFVMGFTMLLSKIILDKFNEALVEGDMYSTESQQVIVDWQVVFPTFDTMVVFVVVGLTIGLIITSFMIPTHPVFLVVNVIGIFFLVFAGMVLSNLYKDIVDNSEDFATVYSTFPKFNFVMNKMPWIAAALVFISTVVMYGKTKNDGGYG